MVAGGVAPTVPSAAAPRAAPTAAELLAPWAQLGDTTLARLEADAFASNRDVRAAQARLARARAARRLAAFDLAPTVTTGAGYTRQRLSAAQFPGVPADLRTQTLLDVGVDASWELDVFGRARRTLAAERAFEGSAGEALRATQLALAAEVARTHYELRGAQREIAVAERNAANQQRTRQRTLDRLAAGRGTGLDRERAAAQLSGTLAAVPQLETRASAAVYRLGVLVGRESAVRAGAVPDAMEAPPIRSASLAADGDALRHSVGPVVSWPAFDLGRVRTRVDAARADAAEARARYDQAVLTALDEAQAARTDVERTRARLARLARAAGASARGASLARLRFTGGAAGFLDVLAAERSALDTERELAAGRTDAAVAAVALYLALGGAWPGGGAAPAGGR